MSLRTFLTALLLITPGLALAHPGHGQESGLLAGFLHPLMGLDHLLAMVGVGLWASQLQQRQHGSGVAGIFLLTLAAGFVMGLANAPGVWLELGIVGSVILVGGIISLARSLPLSFGLGLAALFALFHGLAHGAEMGTGLSATLFGSGFLLSSVALVGLGLAAGRLGRSWLRGPLMVRAGGVAILAAGLVMAWAV